MLATYGRISSEFNNLESGSWLMISYNLAQCVAQPFVSRSKLFLVLSSAANTMPVWKAERHFRAEALSTSVIYYLHDWHVRHRLGPVPVPGFSCSRDPGLWRCGHGVHGVNHSDRSSARARSGLVSLLRQHYANCRSELRRSCRRLTCPDHRLEMVSGTLRY